MLINGDFQGNNITDGLNQQTPAGWIAGGGGVIEIWNPLQFRSGQFNSGQTGLSRNDYVLALTSGASVRQTLTGVDPANAPIIDVNFTTFDRYSAGGEVTVRIGNTEYFAGENTWTTRATPGNPPFTDLGRPFDVNFSIDLSEIPRVC